MIEFPGEHGSKTIYCECAPGETRISMKVSRRWLLDFFKPLRLFIKIYW